VIPSIPAPNYSASLTFFLVGEKPAFFQAGDPNLFHNRDAIRVEYAGFTFMKDETRSRVKGCLECMTSCYQSVFPDSREIKLTQLRNLNSLKFPDKSLPLIATSNATHPCACDGVRHRISCSLTNVALTCMFPNLQLRS